MPSVRRAGLGTACALMGDCEQHQPLCMLSAASTPASPANGAVWTFPSGAQGLCSAPPALHGFVPQFSTWACKNQGWALTTPGAEAEMPFSLHVEIWPLFPERLPGWPQRSSMQPNWVPLILYQCAVCAASVHQTNKF